MSRRRALLRLIVALFCVAAALFAMALITTP